MRIDRLVEFDDEVCGLDYKLGDSEGGALPSTDTGISGSDAIGVCGEDGLLCFGVCWRGANKVGMTLPLMKFLFLLDQQVPWVQLLLRLNRNAEYPLEIRCSRCKGL